MFTAALLLVGLAVATALMTTTRGQRDAIGARWIKPLERPAWIIGALIWGLLLWEPVSRAIRRLF